MEKFDMEVKLVKETEQEKIYSVTSETKQGTKYFVTLPKDPKGINKCTCPDHVLNENKKCKHIGEALFSFSRPSAMQPGREFHANLLCLIQKLDPNIKKVGYDDGLFWYESDY